MEQQDSAGGEQPEAPRPSGPARNRAWLRFIILIAIFLSGVGAGGLAVYFGLERPMLDAATQRIQQYEQDMAALRGRLDKSDSAAAALEGRLLVEESTRRGLETSLRTLQHEFGRAQDSLAFYEQLVPPGPKGVVTVRALDIEQLGPHLRYRLLLMRSGSNDTPFEGSLEFVAEGHRNGDPASVLLLPIVSTASGNGDAVEGVGPAEGEAANKPLLDVSFTDFQRASGLLGLPPDFEPESVTVNVFEDGTLRNSHSVTLSGPN